MLQPIINKEPSKLGFQVWEFGPTGGAHSVSKKYQHLADALREFSQYRKDATNLDGCEYEFRRVLL